MQAAKGVNKEITVNIDDACPRCDGKCHEPGTKVSHCHYCNGTGMVRHYSYGISNYIYCLSMFRIIYSFMQESINTGPFTMRTACRRCSGRGSIIITPCIMCRGTGQTKQKQTVMVPVPAGV